MECLFCQIVAGTQPSFKLYEDEQFLAFLDLYPYGLGHTLVIPKHHYQWVWDVPNLGEYMEVTRKISLHLSRTLNTQTTYATIFGEEVPHAHIHLLPPTVQTQEVLRRGLLGIRQPKLDDTIGHQLQQQLKLS